MDLNLNKSTDFLEPSMAYGVSPYIARFLFSLTQIYLLFTPYWLYCLITARNLDGENLNFKGYEKKQVPRGYNDASTCGLAC